jgi:flavin reductase (DIM6/NTAB) family NADH-FMN oxidoreductase RutF
MIIDPSELDLQSCYKLLIGSVVPRPIAWTSTMSREGTYNLAPFSFFTVASRQPSFPKYKSPQNAPVTL